LDTNTPPFGKAFSQAARLVGKKRGNE